MTEESYKVACENKLKELNSFMSQLSNMFSRTSSIDKKSVFHERHENQMYLIFYTYRMAKVMKRSIQFHIDREDKKVTFLNCVSIEMDLVIEVFNAFYPVGNNANSKPRLYELVNDVRTGLEDYKIYASGENSTADLIKRFIDDTILKYLYLDETDKKWVSTEDYESNNPLMRAKELRDRVSAHRDNKNKFLGMLGYLETTAASNNSQKYGELMLILLRLMTSLFDGFHMTTLNYLQAQVKTKKGS